MNTLLTTGEVARELRTTVPRLHRAVQRGEITPTLRDGRGWLRFDRRSVDALRTVWGVVPAPPSHRSRALILVALLAAMDRRQSARMLARRAGLAPATATRALAGLADDDLVEVGAGGWRLTNRRLGTLASLTKGVELPEVPSTTDHLPRELSRHFWDVDHRELGVQTDAAFIIKRLATRNDPRAWGWLQEAYTRARIRTALRTVKDLDPKRAAYFGVRSP